MKIKQLTNKKYLLKERARTFNYFSYKQYKENRQNDFNKLPIYWAFGEQQFKELLQKLNLKDTPEDLKKLIRIVGGGLMLKTDLHLLKEHYQTYSSDTLIFWLTHNFKFAYDALFYEMNNHEYYYTYEITDTLQSLGLSFEDIEKNAYLKLAYLRARKDYLKACNTCNY